MRDNATVLSRRYAFYLFLIGFGIWLIAITIEALVSKQAFSFGLIWDIHVKNVSFFFIDIIPFALAASGYRFGKYTGAKADALDKIIANDKERNNTLISLVDEIKKGNFQISNNLDKKDKLFTSILELRDSLKSSKEEEEVRKSEDEQRHWVAQGLAKFGEILRANNDDMAELSYNIISQLVKYVSANQGGIYLQTENDEGARAFEMKACYAYDRRKFVDKYISYGEGLVGACAKEGKTVNLKKIPDSYLTITSGLGHANPKFLLLVPLKFNEETHGVLEIASFNEFRPHVVEFIEKVAESIASTIANVKINIRTASLLRDSQEQAEILASQEEEMRQNMEELQATQEDAVRQTERLSGYMNALDSVLVRAEFDSFGNLVSANDSFLEKFEVPHFDDIYDKNITSFIHADALATFRASWANVVAEDKCYEGELKCSTFINKTIFLKATLSRINRNDGEMDKVLLLALEATDQKKEEIEMRSILAAVDESLLKAELSNTGDLLMVNSNLKSELGYGAASTIYNINDFINDLDKPQFEKAWMRLVNQGFFQGVINFTSLDGEVKALDITLVGIQNFAGDIAKIILMGTDKSAIKAVEDKYMQAIGENNELKDTLAKTDEELNKRVREVREQLALQYKEVERIRIRNDKAVDNAPIAMVGFNAQGIIEVFNKKAAEIWGYNAQEAINMPISKLFAKEHVVEEGFVNAICDVDKIKPLNQRENVVILANNNQKQHVSIILADARVSKEHNYIAYVEPLAGLN
jgi:PAS domain-containing protein